MIARHFGILSVLLVTIAATTSGIAQAPAAPTRPYTGNFGGGFAVTHGNTDTRNFNLTGAIALTPSTRNGVKGTANYFRGSQNDVLNLDRTAVNMRDEYTLTDRTLAFGQLDYARDQFKEMIFFWAPTGGVGYKLINND